MMKKSMKKNVSNYIAIGSLSAFSLFYPFETSIGSDTLSVSKKETKKILTGKNFELMNYDLENSTITISPVDNSIGFRDLTRALNDPKNQIPRIAERTVEDAVNYNLFDSSKIGFRLVGVGQNKLIDPIYTGKIPVDSSSQWKTEDGTSVYIVDPSSRRIFLWDNYQLELPFEFIRVDTASTDKNELQTFKSYVEEKINPEKEKPGVDTLALLEEEKRVQLILDSLYADSLFQATARKEFVRDSTATADSLLMIREQFVRDSIKTANPSPLEALKSFEKEFNILRLQYISIKEIEEVYKNISRGFGDRNTLRDDKSAEIESGISDLEDKLSKIERLRRPSSERINSMVDSLGFLKISNNRLIERENKLITDIEGQYIADLSKYERISGLIDSIDVDTAVYPQIKFNVKEPVLDLKSEKNEVTELNKRIQKLEYSRKEVARDDSAFWSDYTKQYYNMLSQTRDEKSKRSNVLEKYDYKGGLREEELTADKKAIKNLIRTIDGILQRKEVKTASKKIVPKRKDYSILSTEEGFFFEPHLTTNFDRDNRYGTSIGYSFGDFLVSVCGNIGSKENSFENTFLSEPNEYGLQYKNEIKTNESTNNGTAYASIGIPLSQRIRLSVGPLADIKTSYTTEHIQEQTYRNGKIISAQPGYQIKKNKTDVRYGANVSVDFSLADKFGVVAGADFSKDARFKLGVRLGR